MTSSDIADVVRDALAVHGVEVALPLDSFPSYPRVLTDFRTLVVKLHNSYDGAWDAIYWTRILGDGGVPVAPLLTHEVFPIRDYFGVVTQYLAPDREADERDAPAAGKIMRHVHDLAFEYLEPDGRALTPYDSQAHNFVLHRGALHLVGIDSVERRDREGARWGAAGDFAGGLRDSGRAQAHKQFLAAYDA